MLFSYGADPNIRVHGEPGNNAILRPALAELLASNDHHTEDELQLLLRHGARVIMKTQFRDPDGLLNCLTNIPADSEVFRMLLDACEEYDPCMIRRNSHLTEEQREILLDKSSCPLTLKRLSRGYFRQLFGRTLPVNVPELFVPRTLRGYLLYEHN